MPYLYMGTIVPLSVVVPIAVGALKYRSLNRPLKIIFWFLIVNGLTNAIAKILSVSKVTNLPLLHIYTVVEFVILLLFYKSLLSNNWLRKCILVTMVAFIILSILNTCFFQSLFIYNSYTRSLEAILIIFFAICYFMIRLESMEQDNRENTSVMVNAALLLYFSGALILFIISNVAVTNVSLGTALWNVHATLVLIMYIMFTIALWKYKM